MKNPATTHAFAAGSPLRQIRRDGNDVPVIADDTIAARVIKALRNDIITKRIAAGSRITIREISARYRVSDMPVREAFRTLEGESLLEMHAYKGATVMRIDARFITETYGITRMLETLLAEEAMQTIDDKGIETLRAVNADIATIPATPERVHEYVEHNTRFHNVVAQYSSNQKAAKLLAYQQHLIRALRRYYAPSLDRVRTAMQEHNRIISALLLKDKFLIMAAIKEHSDSARDSFLRQFEKDEARNSND